MTKFLEVQAPQLVFWVAVGAILVAVVIYVLGKIRGQPAQQEPTASELMSKFRELHAKGVLERRGIPNNKNQVSGAAR